MDTLALLRHLRIQIWDIKMQLWQASFLSFNWWFIAVTVEASYAIWWKLLDKRRVFELLVFGSFVAAARIIFDDWGISSGRWTYVIDLFPVGYSLFLNDLTVVPLAMMLVYQYSPDWKAFIFRLAAVEGAIAFGFLPLLSYLGILHLHAWSYFGSYIFMIITATVMRAIMLFGLAVERTSRAEHPEGLSVMLVPEPAMKPADPEEDEQDEKPGKPR